MAKHSMCVLVCWWTECLDSKAVIQSLCSRYMHECDFHAFGLCGILFLKFISSWVAYAILTNMGKWNMRIQVDFIINLRLWEMVVQRYYIKYISYSRGENENKANWNPYMVMWIWIVINIYLSNLEKLFSFLSDLQTILFRTDLPKNDQHTGIILLTWTNFNPSLDR